MRGGLATRYQPGLRRERNALTGQRGTLDASR